MNTEYPIKRHSGDCKWLRGPGRKMNFLVSHVAITPTSLPRLPHDCRPSGTTRPPHLPQVGGSTEGGTGGKARPGGGIESGREGRRAERGPSEGAGHQVKVGLQAHSCTRLWLLFLLLLLLLLVLLLNLYWCCC